MTDMLAEVWYKMSEVTPDSRLSEIYLHNASLLDPDHVKTQTYMKVRNGLSGMVENREYEMIRRTVRELVELKDWRTAIHELIGIGDESDIMLARVRDAMFHTFDMGPVAGMDIEPLVEFYSVEGKGFSELRKNIHETALGLLRKQIASGNMFYLDTEGLRESPLVVILPEVLESRKKEIMDLPDDPHLNQVMSTYYGFTVFTTTSDLDEARTYFEDICLSLGKRLQVRGVRFTYHRLWSNVSGFQRKLLENSLRLCMTKLKSSQESAVLHLGESGDVVDPVSLVQKV